MIWVEIPHLKHIREINIDDAFDYISVFLIIILDGALLKDNLISKHFSIIHIFCLVKLFKRFKKIGENTKTTSSEKINFFLEKYKGGKIWLDVV